MLLPYFLFTNTNQTLIYSYPNLYLDNHNSLLGVEERIVGGDFGEQGKAFP